LNRRIVVACVSGGAEAEAQDVDVAATGLGVVAALIGHGEAVLDQHTKGPSVVGDDVRVHGPPLVEDEQLAHGFRGDTSSPVVTSDDVRDLALVERAVRRGVADDFVGGRDRGDEDDRSARIFAQN
jgi:hypothetical protein